MRGEIKNILTNRNIQNLLEKGTFLEGGVEILCFILRETWAYMYVKRQVPVNMDRQKQLNEIHEQLRKSDSQNKSILKNNYKQMRHTNTKIFLEQRHSQNLLPDSMCRHPQDYSFMYKIQSCPIFLFNSILMVEVKDNMGLWGVEKICNMEKCLNNKNTHINLSNSFSTSWSWDVLLHITGALAGFIQSILVELAWPWHSLPHS